MFEKETELQPLPLEVYVVEVAELARHQGRECLVLVLEHVQTDAPRLSGRTSGDEVVTYKAAVERVLWDKGYHDLAVDIRVDPRQLIDGPESVRTGETWWSVSLVKKETRRS